jgi:hypothetical protein
VGNCIIVELQANPLKFEEGSTSAWHLAKDKQAVRDVIRASQPMQLLLDDDDIKSEPEDDFESADEGVSELYIHSSVQQCLLLDN